MSSWPSTLIGERQVSHLSLAQRVLYNTQGKYDLAESLLKQAIAILDRAFGASHPDTILYRKNLALMKADREAAGK